MRPILTLICVLLSCLLFACTDDVAQDNNGWEFEGDEDATTDTTEDSDSGQTDGGQTDGGQTDGGQIDAGEETYEVTFELVNESGRPIYAYDYVWGTPLCSNAGYWLTVKKDDQPVRVRENCGVCECDSGDPCAVCDLGCPGPPTAENTAIADGQKRIARWNGHIWRTTDQSCEVAEPATDGPLVAEFCWGTGFDETSSQITGARCLPVEFELEGGSQVVRAVVPEREPHDITFRMINDTGKDLYASPGVATQDYNCYGSWYDVGDGDATYTLAKSCGTCTCSEVEQDPNAACYGACPGMPCPAPTEEALRFAAGTELSDTWDGTIWTQDEVQGQSCERQSTPPLDQPVVTFCYAEEVHDSGGYASLGTTTCEQISFDRLADDEVVLRLQ